MSETKKKKVVYYRDSDGNFIPSGSSGGDMIASKYDTDLDGIVNQADKVTNTLTIKDGSNTYTYDGSEAVEINVVGGGGSGEATSKNVFVGTQAEFDALSEDDQNAVEMFVCTDGDGETDSYATKAALNELIDGSTPAGDSVKLGGLSADKYYNLGKSEKSLTSGALVDYVELGKYHILNDNKGNITDLPHDILDDGSLILENSMLHNDNTMLQTLIQNSTIFKTWERIINPITHTVIGEWTNVNRQTNALTPNNFPSNLSSNNAKTIYLSPTGSDDNVGSSSEPMATLSAAINKFKGLYLLNIKLLDGEYNFDGDSFTGFQSIIIQSNSGDKSKVTVNVSSPINFYDGIVYLTKLTFKRTTSTFDMIVFQRAHSIFIDSCDFVDEGGVVSYGAITFNDASGVITSCEFGGSFTNAIYAARGSQVHSYNNIAKDGSSIANGHCVNYCSVIIENCTTTLGKNYKSGGGQIISTADVPMTQSMVSNPNLLINGDFRVNQRGKSSYSGTGYGVDMWNSLNTYLSVTKNDSSITLSSSGGSAFFTQRIDCSKELLGKTVTWSVMDSDGNVYSHTFTLPSEFPTSSINVGNKVFKTGCNGSVTIYQTYMLFIVSVTNGNSCTLKYAKLELGNVATPFSPRPYGEELALCQRYLVLESSCDDINTGNSINGFPCYVATNAICFVVPIPVQMRARPSLVGTPDTASGDCYFVVNGSGTLQTGFTFKIDGHSPNSIMVWCNKTNHGLTMNNASFAMRNVAGFSAEL